MKNESALPLSEEEISAIRKEAAEFAGIGLYRYKFDGTIIFIDRCAARILEIEKIFPDLSAVAGKNISELIKYLGPVGRLRKIIKEKGEARNLEYNFMSLKGNNKWALHDSYLVRDEKTGEEEIQVIIQDITWRKQAEEALRQREEWLSTVLNSIGDAVIATDPDGKVRFMNPVAEHLTGWPIEKAAGTPAGEVFKIINEETREPVESPITKVLEHGAIVGLANHTVLVSRGGAERPVVDSGAPIKSLDGKVTGAVLVFRDDTERRRSEENIKKAKKEAEFYLDLMTHDLTNFNQIMLGNLELLERKAKLEKKEAHYLTTSLRQVSRSESLITNVKLLSMINNIGAVNLAPAELDRVITNAVKMVKTLYPFKTVKIDYQPSGERKSAGAELLNSLVINILENAVKHSPEDEVDITITVSDADGVPDFWELRIADNGPGVPDAMKVKIFDRFSRNSAEKGTGLGLSLAKAVVEMLGGKIRVEDRAAAGNSGGSVFIFTIPKK